jgi:hypothetical protein
MKKVIFVFTLLIISMSIFAQTDTIILKNGKKITGKITLGDDGVWIRQLDNDLKQFSPDEIQTILFCDNKTAKKCDCDEEKVASVVFTCKVCGGEGSLKIKGGTATSKTNSTYSFNLDKGESFFEQTEHLEPGIYTWYYEDTNNNATNGKFTLGRNEKKNIVLFQ